MAVPEGIVERKDLKVICAPPWGTNYEMKAKKNAKQLSYFYDEQDKKKNPNEFCEDTEGSSPVPEGAMPEDVLENPDVVEPKWQPEHDHKEQSENQMVQDGEGDGRELKLPESMSHPQRSDPILGLMSDKLQKPTIRCDQNRFTSSVSAMEVRSKGKPQYETSNSAYGLYQSEADSDNGLPKSYRRVASFSKLYGDTQSWKK